MEINKKVTKSIESRIKRIKKTLFNLKKVNLFYIYIKFYRAMNHFFFQ